MTQWHPLFTELLRSVVERHYEVQTNLPVGDAPRQADIVLLRRKSSQRPPFHGLWKDLTAWNVVEFKGPTVSARLDDLVELGLGIHRRLNEERAKQKDPPLAPAEMSWWYLADHLGRRFLAGAPRWLGELEPAGAGVWRCVLMRRAVYLVSRAALPIEQESLPLHALVQDSPETLRAVAAILTSQPALLIQCASVVSSLHPNLAKELLAMAKATGKGPTLHLEPLVQILGMKQVVEALGPRRVVDELGPAILDELKVEEFLEKLTPAKRQELTEVMEEQAARRAAKAAGPERVTDAAVDAFVKKLTPAQRRKLKDRLS